MVSHNLPHPHPPCNRRPQKCRQSHLMDQGQVLTQGGPAFVDNIKENLRKEISGVLSD